MKWRNFWLGNTLLLCGGLGLQARAPFLLAWREALPWLYLAVGLPLAWKLRRHRITTLCLLAVAFLPMGLELRFLRLQRQVLAEDHDRLWKLGRHFIVGYRDFNEAENLVRHGAVGGLFLTQRNIVGKSGSQVRQEIRSLQAIQAAQGLPPLYIATDQEGGRVSRLSPLVPAQPSLAVWLQRGSAKEYAEKQAQALAELGVNLNFSPVVDLKTPEQEGIVTGRTLLSQRAISEDPETVAEVATEYCRAYDRQGLRCTLKHFPGLGHVTVDTHFEEGKLNGNLAELERKEWLPFRRTLEESQAFVMLGHVRVSALDDELPASLSRAVVSGLIRDRWGHQGIVITDDFSMGPVAGRDGGVGLAARQALNAGVDLILVSYDGELYYEAMDELLKAEDRGDLDVAMLERSETRLRTDLDRSARRDQVPDLLDLGIAHRDAAVGPIIETVQGAKIGQSIGQAMNHDGTAGRNTADLGSFEVLGTGIRDMEGEMIGGIGIAGVDEVFALRRFMIALLLFGAHRFLAQSDTVSLQDLFALKQRHASLRLFNEDTIGLGILRMARGGQAWHQEKKQQEEFKSPHHGSASPKSG